MEGLRRHGNETLESFACSGEGYDATSYSYFEQRPCLIEQVYLETILWCTRNRCPGCRGNHVDEQLFAGSEVWTTTRHGKPAARNRDDYILNIHRKPENRVTVRVSHPAGNRIETMESIKRWKTRMDPDHHKRLGIWVAEDGCSWRGPRERTAVLYQPADLPGPPGWERAE